MNKLLEILSFIKENLNGEYTRIFIVVVLTLLLYKVLGFVGILIGLILSIAVDVCHTTNVKTIYTFFKNKFFPLLVFAFIITACGTHKNVTESYYSASTMIQISKDTVSSKEYRAMVYSKKIPSLSKFSKTYLKNIEENKVNAYYVYYDSVKCNLYNVKELINNRDTAYVIEKKLLK